MSGSDWGEFLHLPGVIDSACPSLQCCRAHTKVSQCLAAGKRFFDFGQMRQEILQETERITGANKGISDKAIRLKICSPHVL